MTIHLEILRLSNTLTRIKKELERSIEKIEEAEEALDALLITAVYQKGDVEMVDSGVPSSGYVDQDR
jgi:hypothetical protein